MRKPTATDARPPQDRRCDFHIASPDLSGSPYPSDYEVDARDVVDLLAAGAHLVGHSYGAVVAMLAAATRPDLARSLALIEPPPWTVRCPGCPPRRADLSEAQIAAVMGISKGAVKAHASRARHSLRAMLS